MISEDGRYIYVGSPHASKVKTRYQDDFITTIDYLKNDIVKYQDSLWKASAGIQGAEASINFQSFASVTQIRQSLGLLEETDDAPTVLASGNYPFTNTLTDRSIQEDPQNSMKVPK